MSEKLNIRPESHESQPTLHTPERAKHLKSPEINPAEVAKDLKEARKHIAETARSEEENNPIEALQAAEKASRPATPTYVNRELKQITLRRELQHIQRKLPTPQRTLSKIVHQPVVRVVSEAAGKTVSRPSGLLGGGLMAFLGTTGYLYLARHVGFTYNYLIFLLLLVGGFLLGVGLELLVYLATASRHSSD